MIFIDPKCITVMQTNYDAGLIKCGDWSVEFWSSLFMYNMFQGFKLPDSFLVNSVAYVTAGSDDFKAVCMVGINSGC